MPILKSVATGTTAPDFWALAGRGRNARLPRWRRAWSRSVRLEEPWRVGPLVALAEPAVAVLVGVVVLLVALRLGAPLRPDAFLPVALALALLGYWLGRFRASFAFRRWARVAADLPFPLSGAERLLRRPDSSIRVEIRFAVPMAADAGTLQAALDATPVPGAALELVRHEAGRVVVLAFGHGWAAAWAVRRMLSATLPALHEAFPIERVELCGGQRAGAG